MASRNYCYIWSEPIHQSWDYESLTLTPLCFQEHMETREHWIMACKISIYSRVLNFQDHKDSKIYHKATLGLKEYEKYDWSKDKIENFCMELRLSGQTLYWNEVMNNMNNEYSIYNPPEWKCVKGNQDSPIHWNGETFYWCRNHNDGNVMWVVHLSDEWKSSEKPNARFQNTTKPENEN